MSKIGLILYNFREIAGASALKDPPGHATDYLILLSNNYWFDVEKLQP